MKLTVWIAEQHEDNACYNIVARTKKDALKQIAECSYTEYDPPRKVEIYYKDGFDLFCKATSEMGGRSGW